MHAGAGDGRHVDDGAVGRCQLPSSPRASQIGAKKFTWNTWRQIVACWCRSTLVPLAAFRLGRNRGVVDQRVQLAVVSRAISAIARGVASSERSTWM